MLIGLVLISINHDIDHVYNCELVLITVIIGGINFD